MRDPDLTKHARAMRSEMTEPETRLWLELRAKRFGNAKFRRQKVIQDDGHRYSPISPRTIRASSSNWMEKPTRVARPTTRRGQHSSRLRAVMSCYGNNEVIENMGGFLQHLSGVIAELRSQPPLPTLSPEGERAK